LYELIYASISDVDHGETALLSLLEQSRAKNHRLDITGMLVYHQQQFVQVLEGEREAVETLYATIAKDYRHRRVGIVHEGLIDTRGFDAWSMGFIDTAEHDLRDIPGYSQILADGAVAKNMNDHPTTAKKLLFSFRNLLVG